MNTQVIENQANQIENVNVVVKLPMFITIGELTFQLYSEIYNKNIIIGYAAPTSIELYKLFDFCDFSEYYEQIRNVSLFICDIPFKDKKEITINDLGIYAKIVENSEYYQEHITNINLSLMPRRIGNYISHTFILGGEYISDYFDDSKDLKDKIGFFEHKEEIYKPFLIRKLKSYNVFESYISPEYINEMLKLSKRQ